MQICSISVLKVEFGLVLTAAKSLLVVARFGSTSQVNENNFLFVFYFTIYYIIL
jgi:hypothetical protein